MQKLAYNVATVIDKYPDVLTPLHGSNKSQSMAGAKPELVRAVQAFNKARKGQGFKSLPNEAIKFVAAVVACYYQITGFYLTQVRLRSLLRAVGLHQDRELMVRGMVFGPGFRGPITYYGGGKLAYPVPCLVSGSQGRKMAPRAFLDTVRGGQPVDPKMFFEDAPRTPVYDEKALFGEVFSLPQEDEVVQPLPLVEIPESEDRDLKATVESTPSGFEDHLELKGKSNPTVRQRHVPASGGRASVKVARMTLKGKLHVGDGVDLQIDHLIVEGDATFLQ